MPTVEFEFVVQGPPFSVNIAKKQPKKHRDWKNTVGNAARSQWAAEERVARVPTLLPVEVLITTFYTTIEIDVDNVIKPILDALKGIVYANDSQVYKVTSEKVKRVDEEAEIEMTNPLLSEAVKKYREFVYIAVVWIEE